MRPTISPLHRHDVEIFDTEETLPEENYFTKKRGKIVVKPYPINGPKITKKRNINQYEDFEIFPYYFCRESKIGGR